MKCTQIEVGAQHRGWAIHVRARQVAFLGRVTFSRIWGRIKASYIRSHSLFFGHYYNLLYHVDASSSKNQVQSWP